MTGVARWNDLAPRLISAVVMLGVGGAALALGGFWLRALLALVCGAMIWEVICLFAPQEGKRALVSELGSAKAHKKQKSQLAKQISPDAVFSHANLTSDLVRVRVRVRVRVTEHAAQVST
ncbi:MAG: hypothetical protein CMG97_14900, partial [Marinovum sp.]|nr:hypothetical protein [Marinovum sp.]